MEGVTGFPEWLPAVRRAELRLLDRVRSTFELHGFTSVEVASVERIDVLTDSRGRQPYFYQLRPQHESSDHARLGLHYDLTLPLTRYVTQHAGALSFPFRSYQMQRAWQAGRPRRGQFRESYQCDVDMLGREHLDEAYDASLLSVASDVFKSLDLGPFEFRLSHRLLLRQLLEGMGFGDIEAAVRKLLARRRWNNDDELLQALINIGFSLDNARIVVDFIGHRTIDQARRFLRLLGAGTSGVDSLDLLISTAESLGVPSEQLRLDASISSNTDYYTGHMFEVALTERPDWPSVCSGGRYGDLASAVGSKVGYPGVGFSLNMTKLISLMQSDDMLPESLPPCMILLAVNEGGEVRAGAEVARALRSHGVTVDMRLGEGDDHYRYAVAAGIPFVLTTQGQGSSGSMKLRSVLSGSVREVEWDSMEDLVQQVVRGSA